MTPSLRARWTELRELYRDRPFAWATAILRLRADPEAAEGEEADPELAARLDQELEIARQTR